MKFIKAIFSKTTHIFQLPERKAFLAKEGSEEKLKTKAKFIAGVKDLNGKEARNISSI